MTFFIQMVAGTPTFIAGVCITIAGVIVVGWLNLDSKERGTATTWDVAKAGSIKLAGGVIASLLAAFITARLATYMGGPDNHQHGSSAPVTSQVAQQASAGKVSGSDPARTTQDNVRPASVAAAGSDADRVRVDLANDDDPSAKAVATQLESDRAELLQHMPDEAHLVLSLSVTTRFGFDAENPDAVSVSLTPRLSFHGGDKDLAPINQSGKPVAYVTQKVLSQLVAELDAFANRSGAN